MAGGGICGYGLLLLGNPKIRFGFTPSRGGITSALEGRVFSGAAL